MYTPAIVELLRDRGHDAVSVHDVGMTGATDPEVLAFASAAKRTLCTENVQDFVRLIRNAAAAGEEPAGVIFSSPRSLPRSTSTIGVFADALAALCAGHPEDIPFTGQVVWLQPVKRSVRKGRSVT